MLRTLKTRQRRKKNNAPSVQEKARTKKGVKKCSKIPATNAVNAATGIEIKHILTSGFMMLSGAEVAFLIFRKFSAAVSVMLNPNE